MASDTSRLIVLTLGAGGQSADFTARPGAGARVQATVPVTPGTQVQVVAGCQGGRGYGSGGGAARRGPTTGTAPEAAAAVPCSTPAAPRWSWPAAAAAAAETARSPAAARAATAARSASGETTAAAAWAASGGSGGNQAGTGGSRGGSSEVGGGGGGGGAATTGAKAATGAAWPAGGGGGGGSSYVAATATADTYATGANRGDGAVVLVKVAGPPEAPTGVRATNTTSPAEGFGALWVAFTPPDDGGSPITSYTATASASRLGTATATGTGSPILVRGLPPGGTYTFTVRATNRLGTSAELAPSSPVTAYTVPGPPTGVTATAGVRQATVHFTPPANNGGTPLTGYTVVSASDPRPLATGPTSPITVTGLTDGATYAFRVISLSAWTAPHYENWYVDFSGSAPSNPVTLPVLPGAPTGVTATATGDQEITVAFTPPASDGGSPFTSYTVTSATSLPITATGTASPIKVKSTALIPKATYTFTVHATTAVGSGPESAPSNPVVAVSVPNAPSAVSAAPGNSQASVYWSPPSNDWGAPITSYTITTSPGGRTLTVPPPPVRPDGFYRVDVTGLTNGTTYTFTVAATNLAGTGPASAPTNPVTPGAASAPANDNVANAQAISGASGTVSGTNVGAGKEAAQSAATEPEHAAEPDHAGNPGGASIWYKWVVPAGYNFVTFETCGSSFDTLLASYVQEWLGETYTLSALSSNDNSGCSGDGGGPSVRSRIGFDVHPAGGFTYHFAIDGHNAGSGPATGTTVLTWRAQNLT